MTARVLAGVGLFIALPAAVGLTGYGWHGALIGAIACPIVGVMLALLFGLVIAVEFIFAAGPADRLKRERESGRPR